MMSTREFYTNQGDYLFRIFYRPWGEKGLDTERWHKNVAASSEQTAVGKLRATIVVGIEIDTITNLGAIQLI